MDNNIEFIDTSTECMEMLKKLSKDALKEAGKVVTKQVQKDIPVKSGSLKKSIKAWVKIDYQTGQPSVQVGYLSRPQMKKKYGIRYFVNPWWFEFGIRPHTISTKQLKKGKKGTYYLHDNRNNYGFVVSHPGYSGKNLLRNTVYNNINEISSILQAGANSIEDYVIEKGMRIDLGGDEEVD